MHSRSHREQACHRSISSGKVGRKSSPSSRSLNRTGRNIATCLSLAVLDAGANHGYSLHRKHVIHLVIRSTPYFPTKQLFAEDPVYDTTPQFHIYGFPLQNRHSQCYHPNNHRSNRPTLGTSALGTIYATGGFIRHDYITSLDGGRMKISLHWYDLTSRLGREKTNLLSDRIHSTLQMRRNSLRENGSINDAQIRRSPHFEGRVDNTIQALRGHGACSNGMLESLKRCTDVSGRFLH